MHHLTPAILTLAVPFADLPDAPVDSHFHIFAAHQAVPGARYIPSYTAALADWATQALASGVRRGVLVQPSFLGTDNRLMCSALVANPALRGVAVVAPGLSTADLQRLHDQGVRGIRLNLVGLDHDVRTWCQAPTWWTALHRLGWHVQLHTDTGALPAVLRQLLPCLPEDLPVVLDHFAKPQAASSQDATVKALRALVQQGRSVFVKLSAHYRLGRVSACEMVALLLQEIGPSHLLWGSDWPCTNHEQEAHYGELAQRVRDALDNPEVRHAVLAQNPHRLYA